MKDKEAYPSIRVPESGSYRLVPDADFDKKEPLEALWLELPEKGVSLALLCKLHRIIKDLDQKELAKEAAVEACQISLIETGKLKNPHNETVFKLCKVFGERFKRAMIDLKLFDPTKIGPEEPK